MGTREAIQQLREVYVAGRVACDLAWHKIPPASLEEAFGIMVQLVPSTLAKTGREALRQADATQQLLTLIRGTVYANRVIERAIKTLEEIPE